MAACKSLICRVLVRRFAILELALTLAYLFPDTILHELDLIERLASSPLDPGLLCPQLVEFLPERLLAFVVWAPT